ncbi:MAG: TetR/AcrR family transcriptional regulator [Solirubrobacteraceae bacterium]
MSPPPPATLPATLPARDRLMTAALQRVGAEGPVAVSLEAIRRDAGVSVGALYHHFTDKAQLLDALYLELISEFQEGFLAQLRAQAPARDGIVGGVRFYLRWVSHNRNGAAVLLGHHRNTPALRELNRRFFAEVMDWWRTHVHYGTVTPLPLNLIEALWLGPAQEYTRHWLTGSTKQPGTTAVEVLSRAAWEALRARPA